MSQFGHFFGQCAWRCNNAEQVEILFIVDRLDPALRFFFKVKSFLLKTKVTHAVITHIATAWTNIRFGQFQSRIIGKLLMHCLLQLPTWQRQQ